MGGTLGRAGAKPWQAEVPATTVPNGVGPLASPDGTSKRKTTSGATGSAKKRRERMTTDSPSAGAAAAAEDGGTPAQVKGKKRGGTPRSAGKGTLRPGAQCGHEGCTTRAYFGYEGKAATHCRTHKEDKMVDVKNPRCRHAGCTKRPTYGKQSDHKRTHCASHHKDGMIDLNRH